MFSNQALAAAAAASLSMLSPQQIAIAAQCQALLASGQFPMGNPGLYGHQLFGGWAAAAAAATAPPSASSPPLQQPVGSLSPALSVKSTCNNNNVVMSSGKKSNNNGNTSSAPSKKSKKSTTTTAANVKSETASLSGESANAGSPTNSISPECVTKDTSRDKVFTCGVCSRSFGYKHVLQNHERTHTGEKPFKCPECHKR